MLFQYTGAVLYCIRTCGPPIETIVRILDDFSHYLLVSRISRLTSTHPVSALPLPRRYLKIGSLDDYLSLLPFLSVTVLQS